MRKIQHWVRRSAVDDNPSRFEAMRQTTFWVILLSLLTGLTVPAIAQEKVEYKGFNDRFRIYLGGFAPQLSSTISINGEVVTPPPINIEDVLGVSDGESVAWGGVQWNISRRNSIEYEFFQLNRDGFINLFPEPIEVGDLIIESGSISSAFDIGVSRLTYGFSLMRSGRMNLQLKAGLHIADMSVGLQLMGAVCDVGLGEMPPGCPTAQTPPLESEDVTAPLPHFGASYSYAFTENIAARFQAIGFAIEINNIEGSLIEVDADIDWRPWQNFGIGLGLRYFNANIESNGSGLNGEFDLEYYGPAVYVSASF